MLKRSFFHSYTTMLNDIRAATDILGIILAGSRARHTHNDQSDCDIYIIFSDTVTQKQIKNYHKTYNEKYRGKLKLDLSNKALMTLSEFTHYAELGTPYFYDRYNLVHGKIEVDKTNGEIARLVQKIEILTKEEQATIVNNNLGDYISLVYHSVKSYEAGRKIAASLDAVESIEYLLTSLFAFSHRVRPYNKYLEWEIVNHPLEILPWQTQKFLAMLEKIIRKIDMRTLQVIYIEVEKLARQFGFGYKYDAWGVPYNKLEHIKQVPFPIG